MIPAPSAAKWPAGHAAWFFDGVSQFEGGATSFLAQGAARGERLMIVMDSPRKHLWPTPLIDTGDLIVASTTEVYGHDRVVDAPVQLQVFTSAVHEALGLGYAGMRVVADNTSLVAGPDQLEAWSRWEAVVDDFAAHHPLTGLCAFDRIRTETPAVIRLRHLHPRSVTA